MKKYNVVAASAVALSAALAGGSADAHGVLTVTTAKYNAALVGAAGGTITVPWGTTASAVYTVTTLGNGATTSLEVNSRFTVTLPTGFTFNSQPSFTITPAMATTATIIAGGINSNTATFQIGVTPLGVGGTLALNTVSVAGATALQSPGAAVNITEQATNNAQVNNNDAAPVLPTVGPTFASTTGVVANFPFSSVGLPAYQVDLTSPDLGMKYEIDLTPPVFGVTANPFGTFFLTPDGSLAASGSRATISTTDTANITINGFFNGIKAAFTTAGLNTLGPFGTVIQTFPATATSVTYTAVTGVAVVNPPTVAGVDLNILATGTTLLQANNANFTAVFSPGPGVTDFLGGSVTSTGDSVPFTGGTSIAASNFFTGADAGYASLLRLTNESSVTDTVFLVAEPFTGGAPLVGSLGTIGAGVGTVFTEAQVAAATGLVLANSGQRAALTVIAVPGGSVTASSLLVNPGGVVDNVN